MFTNASIKTAKDQMP